MTDSNLVALTRLAVLACAGLSLCATNIAQTLPGTYTGKILANKSVPQIPAQGLPMRVQLRDAKDGLEGTLTIKGSSSTLAPISELPDQQLSAKAKLMGIPVELRFACKGDDLIGSLHGSGFVLDLRAKRGDPAKTTTPTEPAPTSVRQLANLEASDWRTDLAFLREQLPVRHANWHVGLSEQRWADEASRLHADIPSLDHHAVVMRLAQMVALRSDAHTSLVFREASEFATCAIRFRQFADGVFVTAIAEPHRELLGSRLLAVGDQPIAEVLAKLATAQAAENEQWKRYNAHALARPAALHGLGLIDDPNALPLLLANDGQRRQLLLRPGTKRLHDTPPDRSLDSLPLSRRHRNRSYWFDCPETGGTAYLAYHRCRDEPGRPFGQTVVELAQAIERTRAERLIVDLRNNGGGNSNVLEPLLDWLAGHPVLDHPSRLFVAIGDGTFSSAMLNAGDFRTRTRATLIGEPTGGKPNAYGEVGTMRLPRSGLLISYSTQYFQLVDGDPPSIMPDRTIPNLGSDHVAGRDAVFDAVNTTTPAGRSWVDIEAAPQPGIDGVWSGSFAVPAALQATLRTQTLSFTLAIEGAGSGNVQAAIQTVLSPIPLRNTNYEPASQTLTGDAHLPRFSQPVRVSITGQGQTASTSIDEPNINGWAVRSNARTPLPMVVRGQFEALATATSVSQDATALGERLLQLWRDDPTELNAFAWRLLTEDRFGNRYDNLALAAARRLNELGKHSDWQHLDTLALAEFRNGNIEVAIKHARQALALIGSRPESEAIRRSLRTFEAALSK